MKKRARMLAFLLGATMMVGSTMTAGATGSTTTTTTPANEISVVAPIYSMNITDVVVPTKFSMAFNPDGATIKTGESDTSEEQVVSLNYGLMNKSTTDKKVSLTFKVEDQNVDSKGKPVITMASSEDDVTDAADGAYVLYIEAVPGTGITEKTNSKKLDENLSADDLGAVVAEHLSNVTMDDTDDANAVVANGGSLVFALEKATYELKSTGGDITLKSDSNAITAGGNDVKDKFTIKGLGAGSAAGFTFQGSMSDANWSTLNQGIKVSATYEFKDVKADDYGVYPLFTAKEKGAIAFDTDRVGTINKVEFYNDTASDKKYNAASQVKDADKQLLWPAGKTADGVFTPDEKFITANKANNINKVLITYTTAGKNGVTATATIDVTTSDWNS